MKNVVCLIAVLTCSWAQAQENSGSNATSASSGSTEEAPKNGTTDVVAPIPVVAVPQPPVSAEFEMAVDGYLRSELGVFTADRFFGIRLPAQATPRKAPNVGRNDGFALGDARLNIRGSLRDFVYVRLSLDGAGATYDNDNSPNGKLSMGLRDAYTRLDFHPLMQLHVGRFKPPFDREELTPKEDLLFVHRSLESRGVLRHEGLSGDMPGFAPGRQLGLMLSSDSLLTLSPVTIGYALSLTNGNSEQATLNDNDWPAVWLRFSGHVDRKNVGHDDDEEGPSTTKRNQKLQFGVAGFFNRLTTGDAPYRFVDNVVGAGVDAAVQLIELVEISGQLLWVTTEHANTTAPREHALGGHAQVGVGIPATSLRVGYRFAYYDPRIVRNDSTDLSADVNRVMHHTLGLNYRPEAWPIVAIVEYTHSQEQQGRAIANDRVEAALQVNFQ